MWRRVIVVGLILSSLCIVVSAETPDVMMSVERQVYEYLTDEMGMPTSSACGVLANMEKESNFNVTAVGDGGTSYGLCQWHAGRFNSLMVYCQSQGLDYKTVEGQLAYLKHELENSYPELLAALRNLDDDAKGAYRAAYLWCVQFERPAEMEEKGIKRGNVAMGKYWNRYNSIELEKDDEVAAEREVLQMVQQQAEVEVPEPPQEFQEAQEKLEQNDEQTYVRLMDPLIPRHRPKEFTGINGQLAFALAMLFRPIAYCRPEPFVMPEPVWILLEEWEIVQM